MTIWNLKQKIAGLTKINAKDQILKSSGYEL